MRSVSLAIVGFMALASSGVALAQEATPEDVYLSYQEAIAAAEICHGLEFDQTQSDALNVAVMEQVGVPLSAGVKLRLIEDAKQAVRGAAGFSSTPNCDRAPLASMIGLYRLDLNDAVPLPE